MSTATVFPLREPDAAFQLNIERHLAMSGRRSLCRHTRVQLMRIPRASPHRSSFHRCSLLEAFASREETSAGPSFTRIRTPRFSDAAPMARFSNLAAAGPTATHRLLQHKPTHGHNPELPTLTLRPGPRPQRPRA